MLELHAMKTKLLTALLILSSLIGYLEWSGDSHSFLFQAEGEVLYKLFTNPQSAAHPFTLLPLAGQILLVITLFQKNPSKRLTYFGIAALGVLLVFMLLVGLLSLNIKIIGSTLPFVILSIYTIIHLKKSTS